MIDIKLHTPIGVKDCLPPEQKRKQQVLRAVSTLFASYGYEEVESPMFEYMEVFSDEKLGSTNPNDMFRFFDRTGNALALRSDLTPPIARIAATAYADKKGPLRFSYVGNAFRYSESYQGKLYEVSQAGVELMGASSVEADAEVIALAARSLQEAGLEEFRIHIGQVKFFRSVLEETGLSEEKKEQLKDLVAHRNYVGVEEMVEENEMPAAIKELFLQLPRLVGGEEVLKAAASLVESQDAKDALAEMKDLWEAIGNHGVQKKTVFDLGMVNSLNYYTGIIFRGYTYGTGYSVVDGGRYDHLVEQFGKQSPAVGFGMKVDAVLDALEYAHPGEETGGVDALVAYHTGAKAKAFAIADAYRKKGMRMENSLLGDDFDANLQYMKERNIPSMLFFQTETQLIYVRDAKELGFVANEMAVSDLMGLDGEER